MSTTMRGTIRSTALRALRPAVFGLSGVALAIGAAGCSGSSEPTESSEQQEETAEPEQTAKDSEEAAPEEESQAGSDPSDAGGEDALIAAKERFVSFLQVVDDGDYEAACGYTLDPTTGQPPADAGLQACAQGLESELGSAGSIQPGMFDDLDPAAIEAQEHPDGSVRFVMDGSTFPLPMIEHTDGQWYFSTEV